MFQIAVICLVITALLAYVNARFVRLPTTIGVMAVAMLLSLGLIGLKALGGMGDVSFAAQLVGSLMGAGFGLAVGVAIYTVVDMMLGLRMSDDEQRRGADVVVHNISANPEEDVRMGRV